MNANVKNYLLHAAMGLSMGIILSRVGFADYDELQKMLTFDDYRMLLSFGMAIVLAGVIFKLFPGRFDKQTKLLHPGILPGSILFGVGWAVCGACPASVFVQLGFGKLPAMMTLLGIFIGVKLYRYVHARFLRWDTGSCSI